MLQTLSFKWWNNKGINRSGFMIISCETETRYDVLYLGKHFPALGTQGVRMECCLWSVRFTVVIQFRQGRLQGIGGNWKLIEKSCHVITLQKKRWKPVVFLATVIFLPVCILYNSLASQKHFITPVGFRYSNRCNAAEYFYFYASFNKHWKTN